MVPAVAGTEGKKLLLVELDSCFRAEGSLPVPGRLCVQNKTLATGPMLQSDVHEVLVGLPTSDPRVTTMLRESSPPASIYRQWGRTTVLALEFESSDEAEIFVLHARQEAEFFCMTKANLHDSNTLTLSTFRDAGPHELYTMLSAVEVLPVGGNRYRFTSTCSMLEVAKILWKYDSPKRTAGSKHYRVVRDDHNNYVLLGNKRPTRVLRYYRRLPSAPVVTRITANTPMHWYNISNLPRGESDMELKVKLEAWNLPSKVVSWKVDRTSYRPKVWFAVEQRFVLEPVVTGLFACPVVVLPSSPPPRGARDFGKAVVSRPAKAVMAKGAWKSLFTP